LFACLLEDMRRGMMNMIKPQIMYGARQVSRAKEPTMPQVTFYTKAGCHLCEEARDMLDDIAAQTVYELTEIDIRSDTDLFEQYRDRIPVIVIDDDTILEGRIAFRNLASAFHV
jgi:glutaredoxin